MSVYLADDSDFVFKKKRIEDEETGITLDSVSTPCYNTVYSLTVFELSLLYYYGGPHV